MIETAEVGKTYWAVTRARVRAGKGARKVVVTEVGYTTCQNVRSMTYVYAGSSFFSLSELYADPDSANEAVIGRARWEARQELQAYSERISKLRAAVIAAGGAV